MKLNQLTIMEANAGLKKKAFSVLELVHSCLEQIKKVEPKVQAFLTICQKESLEEAKKADKLISGNKDIFAKKPLLGIPVAFKDIYLTENIKTTAASKVLRNYVGQYDATVVKRLKEAGAIIIGKTNLDAWAHGASGENSQFYPTKNPWDLTKVPGGSSSGSAVAVATRSCLLAGGTDTGGSIRYPAGFCNVVGLKPTYGRVSRFGIIAMASSLDTIGHLTKTVEDSALVLSVTASWDKNDSTSSKEEAKKYHQLLKNSNLKTLKIGLPEEYFAKGLDPEIKDMILKAVKLFERQGAKIEMVSLAHTKYSIATYYIIQSAEVSSNLARYDGVRYGFERSAFGDEAKRRIMLGTYTLSAGYYDAYYLKAMKVRSLIKKDFDNVFNKVDLLLTPLSPITPFRLGEKANDPLSMYLCDILVAPASLAGLPALAVPCGFTKNNLPVGMQLIGPQFKEELLFQVANYYQQLTNWHKRSPAL